MNSHLNSCRRIGILPFVDIFFSIEKIILQSLQSLHVLKGTGRHSFSQHVLIIVHDCAAVNAQSVIILTDHIIRCQIHILFLHPEVIPGDVFRLKNIIRCEILVGKPHGRYMIPEHDHQRRFISLVEHIDVIPDPLIFPMEHIYIVLPLVIQHSVLSLCSDLYLRFGKDFLLRIISVGCYRDGVYEVRVRRRIHGFFCRVNENIIRRP